MAMTNVASTSQPQNALGNLEIAEQIMLRETWPQVWLEYIKKTSRGRWPAAEAKLLKRFPRNCCREARRYAEEVIQGRWRKLEEKILAGPGTRQSNREVLLYTRDVVKQRWDALERHLLERCRKGGGLLECVEYASIVMQGRWTKLEQEFLDNPDTVSAEVLYRYACNVVEGRLPEKLHNLMTMKGMMDSENEWSSKYFKAKKYQRVRKPRQPTPSNPNHSGGVPE